MLKICVYAVLFVYLSASKHQKVKFLDWKYINFFGIESFYQISVKTDKSNVWKCLSPYITHTGLYWTLFLTSMYFIVKYLIEWRLTYFLNCIGIYSFKY